MIVKVVSGSGCYLETQGYTIMEAKVGLSYRVRVAPFGCTFHACPCPLLCDPHLLPRFVTCFSITLPSTTFPQPDTVLSYKCIQTDMEVSVIMADRPITTAAPRLMALPGGE